MRHLTLALLALSLIGSSTATADVDWSEEITNDPATNTGPDGDGSRTIIGRNLRSAYFNFGNTDTISSSFLFVQEGYLVDICVDDDTGSVVRGSNVATVHILKSAHVLDSSFNPPNQFLTSPLLGATLDSVAALGGLNNDCIYNIEGPIFFQIDQLTQPTLNEALVSVIGRRRQK